MGSAASRTSRVAGAAARKYRDKPTAAHPSRSGVSPQTRAPTPPRPAQRLQPGPTVRPQPQASGSRDQGINLDASDPDFAQSLRSIGPVQPNPTLSPSSAFTPAPGRAQRSEPDPRSNPAITALHARSRIQEEADQEFLQVGRRGHQDRQFLDVYTIRQILMLRDEHRGKSEEIERRLGLKRGVVDRLGAQGVVQLAQETGRAEREVRMV